MKVVGGVFASFCLVWLAWAAQPVAAADGDLPAALSSTETAPPRAGAAIAKVIAGIAAVNSDAAAPVEDASAPTEAVAGDAQDSDDSQALQDPQDLEGPQDSPDSQGSQDLPDSQDSQGYQDLADSRHSEGRDSGDDSDAESVERPAFELLGASIPPGEARSITWTGIESFVGDAAASPVLVAHGRNDGPVLCLSAAVHGDELNGIEIVRRVMHDIDPEDLAGTVIGVPIVNVYGFQRASRYLPDRRDLNRYFPGSPRGSSASRIAHAFFEGVIRHCDMLVDIHTGSFHRTNLTQLRADISRKDVRELCAGFGAMPVLHNVGSPGTLRRAATDVGIPAVTIEAGEPMRLEARVVNEGVAGIDDLLAHTDMIPSMRLFGSAQPLYFRSTWVRSDAGGILFSLKSLGDEVDAGEEVGIVTDPITNRQSYIRSPYRGTILGMAVNQFVMPGFAVFRIGIETSSDELDKSAPATTLDPEPPLEGAPPIGPNLDLEERPE